MLIKDALHLPHGRFLGRVEKNHIERDHHPHESDEQMQRRWEFLHKPAVPGFGPLSLVLAPLSVDQLALDNTPLTTYKGQGALTILRAHTQTAGTKPPR